MATAGPTERREPLSGREPKAEDPQVQAQKRAAAEAAAELVEADMRVGLGTGTTVAYLLPALARRGLSGLRCVATSPATAEAALALGLPLDDLDSLGGLDIAIDGADQVDPVGWLIKGGGGAHTREKIVAAAAERFVVIVSADKDVAALSPPVPLELVPFSVGTTLRALAPAAIRDGAPPSPDGGVIADYTGAVGDPLALQARLASTPGVVEHGLFPPEMVSLVIVGGSAGALELRQPSA
jgi:ribose 5-phosphate isomerase A